MKTNRILLFTLITLALLAAVGALKAQTAVSSVPDLMASNNVPEPTNHVDTLKQLEQAGKDGYQVLRKLSFKDGVVSDTFGIYHHGDYGVGLAVSTAATNSLNYGFAVAAIQETKTSAAGVKTRQLDFYDGSFSISYNGETPDWPVVGVCGYYAETGAATDLSHIGDGIYNQSSLGAKKTWNLNDNVYVSLGGGPFYLSKWNDVAYIGFFELTSKLHGKHLWGLW